MQTCHFLLFGYGRDGEVHRAEYDGSGKLEYVTEMSPCESGADGDSQPCYMSLAVIERYIVTQYQSYSSGEMYLIATVDGVLPEGVDDRIQAWKSVQ